MDPENYLYSKYYNLSLVRPPFAVDWDAFETDYIKVEISADPKIVAGHIVKINKLEVMTPYFLFSLITLFSIFMLIKKHSY